MQDLIDTFVNPGALFTRLRERPNWLLPFLILAVFGMASYYFLFPYLAKASVLAIPENTPPQQAEAMRQFWAGSPKWSLLIAPLGIAFLGVLYSAILLGVIAITGKKARFVSLFAAEMFAMLVTIPSGILTALVVYLRGLDNVNSMMDVQWTIGPAAFIPTESKALFAALSRLNLFEIWYVVLMVIAVEKIAGLKRGTAATIVVGVWILGSIVTVAASSFR